MNVFEDLVVELKEEKLLEDTIIDMEQALRTNPHEQFPGVLDGTYEPSTSVPESRSTHSEPYKTRAIAAVATLQLVDHVISAAEASLFMVVPDKHDDLETKKSLHRFLQNSRGPESEAADRNESGLADELAAWNSSLARRDAAISPEDLRHFIENSRPALSPQAMFALLRFYRAVESSKASRAKFEVIVTRLFSKAGETDEMREMLCDLEEAVGHLRTKYAEWGIEGGYAEDAAESRTAQTFLDMAGEAESAGSLDELTGSEFFQRFKTSKENAAANIFTPLVAASVVKANIRISNRFVELYSDELRSSNTRTVRKKYENLLNDFFCSFSRTIDVGHLQELFHADLPSDPPDKPEVAVKPAAPEYRPVRRDRRPSLLARLGISPWMLAITILSISASAGVYIWAEYYADPSSSVVMIKAQPLEGVPHSQHLKLVKIIGENLHGVAADSFTGLPKAEREKILADLFEYYSGKGVRRLRIMNGLGKQIAFADENKKEDYGS